MRDTLTMVVMGRPEYPEEQFDAWLEQIRPFLENAASPYHAMELAGIAHHKNVIYQKYRLDAHFREKVDRYRQKPGEIVNEAFVYLIRTIADKAKRSELLSNEEVQILKFYAEKARAAQGWFVTRQETAVAKPITDEMLDIIEAEGESINDVTTEIKKQMVATEQPVQDQKQIGETGQVSPQPDATQVSAG